MLDYRLTVFDAVCRRMSFTKAAEELCITQPAITRHVRELEKHFRARLFDRNGNRITLTEAGRLLLKHTHAMHELSRRLEQEIDLLSESRRGVLKLGASTTIAQYVLPPVLARFRATAPEVRLTLLNANTEQVEQALIHGEIDLGLIEGDSKRRDIRYLPFAADEIVLVCGEHSPWFRKGQIGISDLGSVPLLFREPGSGTLEVLRRELKRHGMKISLMTVDISLGSTEAIKSYLMHSTSMAFISRHAVIREIESAGLKVIDVDGLSIRREFSFILPQGVTGGLADFFIRFAAHCYDPPHRCFS